jgi:uncharacterized protein (UPF0332 family)
MNGSDFITLAGKLAVTPTDEAAHRTAISRAYYGAFHVARSFLLKLGFRPVANASVHAFIRQYLGASGHPEAYFASSELSYLQAARNRADYDLEDTRMASRDFAMKCVEQAHRIVAALDACRRDDARDSIREAITNYEQRVRPR